MLDSLLPSWAATKESVGHHADAVELPTRATQKKNAYPNLHPSMRSIDAGVRALILLLAGATMFNKTGFVLAIRMCLSQKSCSLS